MRGKRGALAPCLWALNNAPHFSDLFFGRSVDVDFWERFQMLNLLGARESKRSGVAVRVACASLVAATAIASAKSVPPAQSPAAVPSPHSVQAAPAVAPPKPGEIHIKVINALTNEPIHDERLNVALREDQIGSVAMGTDKNGIIVVTPKRAVILRILANMYADCRPREELYINYSVATVLSTGITTGNLCSSASPVAKPGELILYEVPKTYLRQYPAPPVDSLPHHPN
jgi:hypothetical protein